MPRRALLPAISRRLTLLGSAPGAAAEVSSAFPSPPSSWGANIRSGSTRPHVGQEPSGSIDEGFQYFEQSSHQGIRPSPVPFEARKPPPNGEERAWNAWPCWRRR